MSIQEKVIIFFFPGPFLCLTTSTELIKKEGEIGVKPSLIINLLMTTIEIYEQ
jgi:hypothetical protein